MNLMTLIKPEKIELYFIVAINVPDYLHIKDIGTLEPSNRTLFTSCKKELQTITRSLEMYAVKFYIAKMEGVSDIDQADGDTVVRLHELSYTLRDQIRKRYPYIKKGQYFKLVEYGL